MSIKNFSVTYLKAFVITSLPFLLLLFFSPYFQIEHNLIALGLTFSVIASLILALKFSRRKKQILFSSRKLFTKECIQSMDELGYELVQKKARILIFQPSFNTSFFTGQIFIKLSWSDATLDGPACYVRKLSAKLSEAQTSEPHFIPPASQNYCIMPLIRQQNHCLPH